MKKISKAAQEMSTENSAKPREFEVYGKFLGTNFPEWGICECPEVTDEFIRLREVLTPDPRDEELEKLRDELNRAREDIAIYKSNSEDRAAANELLLKDRNKLRDELNKAREVIEFYADSDNWSSDRIDWGKYLIIDESDKGDGSFDFNENCNDSGVGGKRARAHLDRFVKGET